MSESKGKLIWDGPDLGMEEIEKINSRFLSKSILTILAWFICTVALWEILTFWGN